MYKKLLFLIIIQLISCTNRNEDLQTKKDNFEISINNVAGNSVSINYKIQNIESEKYLIASQSENFDLQNFEIKIPIQDNEGTLKVDNLSPNKTYYFKGVYNSKYGNTVSAITKEVGFTTVLDKNIGLLPDNGNFISLMSSELDNSKTNIFIITKQRPQYGVQNIKIQLHKLDLNGNLIWTKLIQNFDSYALSKNYNGCKIQLLSDGSLAVITAKWDQTSTIVTKIDPASGTIIWQKEYPLINLDGYQSNNVYGYSYQNSTIKIITNPGDWQNAEEIFINNDGNILSQRTIKQNVNNFAMMNAKYLNDGSVISVSAQNQYPKNSLWTYEGCIRKFDLSNSTSNAIWSKFYGDYGGDDSFDNYVIKDDNLYIDGYYGGNSGYSDKQHWILKTDLIGNILWQNKLPVKKSFIYQGLDLFINNENDSFSLMNEMYAPVGVAPLYNIITLTKLDKNGNFLWEWSDGKGNNNDTFMANRAFQLNNGEFLITGDRSSNQTGGREIRFLQIKVN